MTRPALAAVTAGALALAGDQVTKLIVPSAGGHTYANPELSLGTVGGPRVLLVAVMALTAALGGVIGWRWVAESRIPALALGLALGGAVSNLADRAVLGAVRDVFVVGPIVVNLADLAVVGGVTGMAVAHLNGLRRPSSVR